MAVKLGSNIASLTTQRRVSEAGTDLSKIFERLSSGQRINRASDDAAGLAIADSLNLTSKIYSQGIRNGNDGISLLNITDAAIDTLSSIVIRIKELSEQSANGSYSSQQRQALDNEAQQLSKEFSRITRSTSFNGINLLSGGLGQGVNLQLGVGTGSSLGASIGGAVGTGTFGAQTQYSNAYNSSAAPDVALGDLNGDGILDAVSVGIGPINSLQVRLGDGNGNFGPATSYGNGYHPYNSLALGDLNGDGILDIVTVYGSDTGSILSTRFGNGDGTFGASIDTSLSWTIGDLQLGDLNGDGRLDIIASQVIDPYTSSGSGYIISKLSNGNGTFGTDNLLYSDHNLSVAFSLADFNGDGKLDIVTAGHNSSDGYIKVRAGNGNGSFGSVILDANIYPNGGVGAVTVGDLNGDGKLDIIATGNQVGTGYMTTILSNGNGSFQAVKQQNIGTRSSDIALADLNNDGVLDAVTLGSTSASVHFGDGSGSFSSAVYYTMETSGSYGLALGDLNSDGIKDLVTVGINAGNSGRLSVRLANTIQGVAGLEEFSLVTVQDSRKAMLMLDKKLSNLSKQRGVIGASQSRVGIAISNLQSARENLNAAESRIRDADIAAESANLIRTQIIQQSGISILAQANQAPALALKLLNTADS